MFSARLLTRATDLLAAARTQKLSIATAESCTGGLIAALLTEIAGSSDVFERGFVTYSNQAKMDMLSVPETLLIGHGAVSKPVALAMAKGALLHSPAQMAVAVTGIAGPGGGSLEKPVGLVYVATMRRDHSEAGVVECHFGDIGRDAVRLATVEAAITQLANSL